MKFTSSVLLAALALASTTYAHMEMETPAPRNSKRNKFFTGEPDYSMTAPLGAFPCKGYGPGPSVQTFKAGSSIPVNIIGGAPHNGGHCQFSLSYDGGKTFVVIHSVMKECLRAAGNSFNVPIPQSAPSSNQVVFVWTWVNRTGNREFYMNCADITIEGTQGGSITGPQMTVANLPGYPTIPEFSSGGYDGSDLYEKAPIITVGGNGSQPQPNPPASSSSAAPVQSPAPSYSQGPAPSSAPVEPVTSSTPGVPSSAPVEPATSSTPVVPSSASVVPSSAPVVPASSSSAYVELPVASPTPIVPSSYPVNVPSPITSAQPQPPIQSESPPTPPVGGAYDNGQWDSTRYGWEKYKKQYDDGSFKDKY